MEAIGQEVITLLRYLLPGFLAAWVYYGLTSFALPLQFERVVQALIFTLLVQPLVFIIEASTIWIGRWQSAGPWNEKSELLCSVISAFVLGAMFAAFANNDKFHKLMRALNITRETSYPSEWYGAFSNHITYIIINLNNGMRIYGWPTEWPSQAGAGYFLLEQTSWLDDENNEIPMPTVSHMLIPAADVALVQFMDLNWRKDNVKEGVQPAAAASTIDASV